MRSRIWLLSSALAGLGGMVGLTGCGQAPAAGGPPGEFAVPAVVAAVEPSALDERIRLVGTLRATATVDIVTELSGTLETVTFTEGDAVVRGQKLAHIRDDVVRARLNEAEARFELAAANFVRGKDLLQSQTIAQSDFDRLIAEYGVAQAAKASAEANLRETVIRAPFDGVVAERKAHPGQYLNVGQAITTLVQLDPLEAEFRVPERFLTQVQPGQSVSLTTTALGDEVFPGTVFFVSPRVDEASRTVLVKAQVPNPDGQLKSGMSASLKLTLRTRSDALLIPETAVHYRSGQARVLVLDEDDRAEVRPITPGTRLRGQVEIKKGIQAGDRVVIEGHQKLGPGTKVVIAPGSTEYGLEPTLPDDV